MASLTALSAKPTVKIYSAVATDDSRKHYPPGDAVATGIFTAASLWESVAQQHGAGGALPVRLIRARRGTAEPRNLYGTRSRGQ